MLQHAKVGHIALSQMIIFIFGLKTPHLIYLGPTRKYRYRMYTFMSRHTCAHTVHVVGLHVFVLQEGTGTVEVGR